MLLGVPTYIIEEIVKERRQLLRGRTDTFVTNRTNLATFFESDVKVSTAEFLELTEFSGFLSEAVFEPLLQQFTVSHGQSRQFISLHYIKPTYVK